MSRMPQSNIQLSSLSTSSVRVLHIFMDSIEGAVVGELAQTDEIGLKIRELRLHSLYCKDIVRLYTFVIRI